MAGTLFGKGYWLASHDGDVRPIGDAVDFGSMKGQSLNKPVVGIAATPTGNGYWLTAGDGGIFTFGDAGFFGSTGGQPLNKPVVGIAGTPTGQGYWLTAGDGGVFTFGDAGFFGSMATTPLNEPVVGIAGTPTGQGYWLTAADGGVFTFGDAGFFGSMATTPLNKPVVGIEATPSGNGYWLVASDGGVFTLGDAAFAGSLGNKTIPRPVVGFAASPTGQGYGLVDDNARVYGFGDAGFASLIITASVTPPKEDCEALVVETTGTFSPPIEVIDCPDPFCGRLIHPLRVAARTKDAKEILARGAVARYRSNHSELSSPEPNGLAIQDAFSDLAVTGRAAYASFRTLVPVEADLTPLVTSKLSAAYPAHQVVAADLTYAITQALTRAYKVAWALRGPVSHRSAQREALGWIAVTAEDDPPHRPVNVGSALFPHYDLTVQVGTMPVTPVTTRFVVASRQFSDEYPVDLTKVPPETPTSSTAPATAGQRTMPTINGDVVLFIHGHSSSAEEAMPLVGPLLQQADNRGRQVTLISLDLPSNGYASMIEHTDIAKIDDSLWNSGYPILDFIEDFIVGFVDELEALQPGFPAKIVGVIGGSLGGNMGLRLARRDPATHPWLHSVVSWSPASTWTSWARATIGIPTKGRFYDLVKHEGVGNTWGNSIEMEVETPFYQSSINKFFYSQTGTIKTGRMAQSDHWYSKDWPCREAAKESSHRSIYEIYNESFRRWHWRVAHEQLIYSHWDSDTTDPNIDPDPRVDSTAGPPRYSQIKSRMLLAGGHNDDEMPEKIFSMTQALANEMTMVDGTTLWVRATGHSIPTERPVFFAGQILDFLYRTPAKAVWIKGINVNPPGRDVDNEWVEIRNDTPDAVEMAGWTLRDAKNHTFKFPVFELPAGGGVKVWTKYGVNDAENLFWKRGSAVWNNTGDRAELRDAAGADVARYAY
jgi:pimeloyl-ACP methyl ester carboxylesterase